MMESEGDRQTGCELSSSNSSSGGRETEERRKAPAPDGGSKKTEGAQLAPADQHYLLCVTASQDFHEKQRSAGMHG